jgi:hypothetical protein
MILKEKKLEFRLTACRNDEPEVWMQMNEFGVGSVVVAGFKPATTTTVQRTLDSRSKHKIKRLCNIT